MNRLKNQRGIALMTAVLVMAILILVIGVTIVIAITETNTSQNNVRAEQALNYAEAGIHWGAAKLRANPDFSITTTYLPTMAPSVSVGVRVINPSESTTATVEAFSIIASIGTEYPAASRSIRATFLVPKGVMPAGTLFERAITANGTIGSKNNAEIHVSSALPSDGISILSNYDEPSPPAVSFGKLDYLDGKIGLMEDATYSGLSPSQIVQPATQDLVPTLTTTEINAWKAAAMKEDPGHYFPTSQNWGSGITLDGIYFVNGDLTIDNKLDGNGTLVVNGNLTTQNKTNWSSTSMALIVTGNASLDMKNKASITGYIYVNGDVEFKNKFTLVGSIAATGDVYFKNSGTITFQYLGDGGTYLPPGFTGANKELTPFSWQEILPSP